MLLSRISYFGPVTRNFRDCEWGPARNKPPSISQMSVIHLWSYQLFKRIFNPSALWIPIRQLAGISVRKSLSNWVWPKQCEISESMCDLVYVELSALIQLLELLCYFNFWMRALFKNLLLQAAGSYMSSTKCWRRSFDNPGIGSSVGSSSICKISEVCSVPRIGEIELA